jgi:hypothetical protein
MLNFLMNWDTETCPHTYKFWIISFNLESSWNIVVVDVDVDSGRLRLWIAATKGPIVHPPSDIWTWRATVEWYLQEKTEELGQKSCPSSTFSTTNPK